MYIVTKDMCIERKVNDLDLLFTFKVSKEFLFFIKLEYLRYLLYEKYVHLVPEGTKSISYSWYDNKVYCPVKRTEVKTKKNIFFSDVDILISDREDFIRENNLGEYLPVKEYSLPLRDVYLDTLISIIILLKHKSSVPKSYIIGNDYYRIKYVTYAIENLYCCDFFIK